MRVVSTRGRWSLPLLTGMTAVLCAAACAGPSLLEVADEDVELRTDRASYTLEYTTGMYWLDLTVTYVNRRPVAVYFHRECGSGNEPHRVVRRVDDSGVDAELGQVVCITQELRPPIEVGPGETYVDRVMLHSLLSPGANPPITMAERTGTFRLEYFIQGDGRVDGWEPVALLPEARRVSNSFRVTASAN
jgi:hypothetical protein